MSLAASGNLRVRVLGRERGEFCCDGEVFTAEAVGCGVSDVDEATLSALAALGCLAPQPLASGSADDGTFSVMRLLDGS